MHKVCKIGLVSVSDRASSGTYQDLGIPTLVKWLEQSIISPFETVSYLIADEQDLIESTLKKLVELDDCQLIFTTGGTGPCQRDVTPEATMAVCDKILPGFGEQMRQISLNFVPTAILSRQLAGTYKQCLIVNLPGQPKAINETLTGIENLSNNPNHRGIFSAIPYCVELLSGLYLESDPKICKSFRPKSSKFYT